MWYVHSNSHEHVVFGHPVPCNHEQMKPRTLKEIKTPMKLTNTRTGLARLLAAFSLASSVGLLAQTASRDGNASGDLAENEKEEIVVLTPFTVTTTTDTGYGAMQASSGRLGELYIDTPQATSIITSEILKDAKLVSSYTALKFVANAEQTQSGHSPGYNIRGLNTGEIFYDGFGIGGQAAMDTAFFDRVEVVKGPATAGYGRGNPAGFINFVSKTPSFTQSTQVETSIGTGGPVPNQRVVLDNNGFVTKDGKTAYRLVSVYSRGSATKEGSGFERSGAQLAVQHNLRNGQIIATTNLYNNHNPSVIGADLSNAETYEKYLYNFYAPGTLPSHTLFPDADVSLIPNDIGILDMGMVSSLVLNYKLSENWSTRQAINFVDRTLDGTWSGPAAEVYDPVTKLGRAYVFRYYSERRSVTYQSDFLYQYENAATNSNYKLLFGTDYSDSSNQGFRPVTNSAPAPLIPWNPDLATYSFPLDVAKLGTRTTGVNRSVYAQLTAGFLNERIRASAAVRKNYFDLETRKVATNAVTSTAKNDTPLFGTYSLLFKATPTFSLYATKAKYQEPARTANLYRGLPADDPRLLEVITVQPTTDMTEFGLKGTFLDDRIAFTVARYQTDNTGSTGYTLLPKVMIDGIIVHASVGYENTSSTEGWEFEVFGKISERLTFMAGGGIQDGTATSPNQPDAVGESIVLTFNNDPGDALFARLKYTFGPSPEEGLMVVAGIKTYFKGWTYWYGSTPNSTASQSYSKTDSVVDMGLSYGLKGGKYRIGLDVTNAFHPDASVHTFGGQSTESGRLVFLSFDAKF